MRVPAFITKKDLLERIKYLEEKLEMGYIPQKSGACASCEKSVFVQTRGGGYQCCCIDDVLRHCKDFKRRSAPQKSEQSSNEQKGE